MQIDHLIRTKGEISGEKRGEKAPEEAERRTQGPAAEGGEGDDQERQKSGLSKKIKGVRTDARPRSRKTLSGEDADWEDKDFTS